MAWLRRGSTSDDVPRGWPDRLATVLRDTLTAKDHLKDTQRYVVSGEPVRVLATLGAARSPYYMGPMHLPATAKTIYDDFEAVNPEVWVRWGRVLEACSDTSQWSTPLSAATGFPAWAELLLNSIGEAFGADTAGLKKALPVPLTAVVDVLEAGGTSLDQLLDAVFTDTPNRRYMQHGARPAVAAMPGYADAFVVRRDRLAGRLTSGSVDQRLLFCELVDVPARP